jgi:hypothetical protein
MFQEHHNLTEKLSLPEDLGGRRFEMTDELSRYKLPLNQFSIQKTRLLKEIKTLLPYSQKDTISFLNNKEKIKTGILHSLNDWLDSPGFQSHLEIEMTNQQDTLLSALEKGMIEDLKDCLQKLHVAVTQCKSQGRLRNIVQMFKSYVSKHGYLDVKLPYGYLTLDTNNRLAKLISGSESYFDSEPHVTERRKKRKVSAAVTGWKSHLM